MNKNIEEKKRPSWYWHVIYAIQKRAMILDPDGWDRKNYDKSWNEPITYEEFEKRAMLSTHDFATMDRFVYVLDQAIHQTRQEVLEEAWIIARNSKPKFFGKDVDDKTETLVQDVVYETRCQILDDLREAKLQKLKNDKIDK